jgi:hypothetical protein
LFLAGQSQPIKLSRATWAFRVSRQDRRGTGTGGRCLQADTSSMQTVVGPARPGPDPPAKMTLMQGNRAKIHIKRTTSLHALCQAEMPTNVYTTFGNSGGWEITRGTPSRIHFMSCSGTLYRHPLMQDQQKSHPIDDASEGPEFLPGQIPSLLPQFSCSAINCLCSLPQAFPTIWLGVFQVLPPSPSPFNSMGEGLNPRSCC